MRSQTITSIYLSLAAFNGLFGQTPSNQPPQKPMKEYALLLRYDTAPLNPIQLKNLKQSWEELITEWKNEGIYISAQVLSAEGAVVTPDSKMPPDKIITENGLAMGAIVTIKATAREEAILLAEKTPALTVGGAVEVREIQPSPKLENCKAIFIIDYFLVPEDAREAFLERVAISRDFLRSLSGFIEDHAYEKIAGEGKFNYVTIATWENEDVLENAKKIVAAEYKKQNFNMPAFLKKYSIAIERAVYTEMQQ